MNNTLNSFTVKLTKTILAAFAVVTILSGAALADSVNLDMEGSGSATIPKGNTITRKILRIPAGFDGYMSLRLKWHAVNLIPNTFNPLKVVVKQGETTLKSANCYSFHSNKPISSKCEFTLPIQANGGVVTIIITNNSNDEVIGFDIEKGSDINPLVPNYKSTFTPDCPNTVNLDMEGTTLTLPKGNSAERKIYGIGKTAGVITLKIKWHAVAIFPTFNKLNIELYDSKGNKVNAASGNFFSMHAPSANSPQYEITINATNEQTEGPNSWNLKITNNSNQEVIGFNIVKESGDLNPQVPSFKSTYKASCSF